MSISFKDFELRLVSPNFDSPLTETLMELNHLRRMNLSGTTTPWIFFQLKDIFHILESVGSARIEGNRTTISEYIEQKIENKSKKSESFSEIANVESAMEFIEENISKGTEITHSFIRQLHHLAVDGLIVEGDKTPGSYRSWNVQISQAEHIPPEFYDVQPYMDELVDFINNADPDRYELLKTAIAHHRFTWIHPFGNGNGRVVRLLTYAMLIKYGFNVKDGKLLNPTAVFCNDRDLYYKRLSEADNGDDTSLLNWCEYVLQGIVDEISKVNRLLDFDYLSKKVLFPTIALSLDRGYINDIEANVLFKGVQLQKFKSSELDGILKALSSRQKTHLISKMKDGGLIRPFTEKGRTYHVNFVNNSLMRCLIKILEQEGFIPSID